MNQVDLCVIGAGISGLSLAAFASEKLSVCVLERESTVGGLLQSRQIGEALFDEAANGWLDSEPAVDTLTHLIGAQSVVTPANTEQATRYLVNNGLHALSPKLLMKSTPLLSLWQKFRIARELIWTPSLKGEPSMSDFMAKRFGKGILDNFLAPMCAGIYADTPEHMSVRAAFPNLWKMASNGSILWQLIQRLRDKTRTPPHLTSMQLGSHQLCQKIAEFLADKGMSVQTNSPATHLDYSAVTGWLIDTPNGPVQAKTLAITCPASAAAQLLKQLHPAVSNDLHNIEYSPVAVVMQAFERSDFTSPPIGFGALQSRFEQQSGLLGILFTSHLYPHRCPANLVMTRSLLGGSILPDIVFADDSVLEAVALEAHRTLFDSPNLHPAAVQTIRWKNAIPRYGVGHWAFQERMHQFHHANSSLRLSGNHLFGVAVKDCIRIGQEHANHFIHTLTQQV